MSKTDDYQSKINEALEIQKKYSALIHPIWGRIGRQSNFNPNFWVCGQAKNYIFASAKLAGQILEALQKGHLQLGVVGSRTLFEMAVNATYIYNHPKKKLTVSQMRKICKEIVRLANKKRKVNHSRIEGSIKERLYSMGMGNLYNTTYRVTSDWAHLQSRAVQISADAQKAEKFGIETAGTTLQGIHNTFDSVCAHFKFSLDPDLERSVIAFSK